MKSNDGFQNIYKSLGGEKDITTNTCKGTNGKNRKQYATSSNHRTQQDNIKQQRYYRNNMNQPTMRMKLAFYKAKGDWIDLLIRVFTHSPYSHCEIVINKDWYSSSPRDGGVRIKQIQDDGNSWDFVEVEIDKERLYQKYREYKGKGYDFKGILLSNIIPIGWHSKNKVTCSEFVADVLGYPEPAKYSPQDIVDKLKLRKGVV